MEIFKVFIAIIFILTLVYRVYLIRNRRERFLNNLFLGVLVFAFSSLVFWACQDFQGFFNDPNDRLVNFICYAFLPLSLKAFLKYTRNYELVFNDKFVFSYLIIVGISFYTSGSTEYNIESLIVSMWFLGILGFISGFLGPIMFAINLTVLISNYSNFNPIGINEVIFVWDAIFDLLNISNSLIKVVLLILSTLISAKESINYFFFDQ